MEQITEPGIIALVLAGLALVGAMAYWLRRRRANANPWTRDDKSDLDRSIDGR